MRCSRTSWGLWMQQSKVLHEVAYAIVQASSTRFALLVPFKRIGTEVWPLECTRLVPLSVFTRVVFVNQDHTQSFCCNLCLLAYMLLECLLP